MSKEKHDVLRVAKQLPYIKPEDIDRMKDPSVTVHDCYRILKQRRIDWD